VKEYAMRKILILFILLTITITGAFAQDPPPFDLSTMETVFTDFASGVAGALPMASTVGLQWSDAYIGNLPHFGVGVSVGFASIPLDLMFSTFETLLEGDTQMIDDIIGYIPPEIIDFGLGFPFPAAVADARLGGLFLPFDIGVKIGMIPDPVYEVLGDVTSGLITRDSLDYFLLGFDIRIPLLKEPKGISLIPDLIIGGGYNYYRGGISIPMPGMESGFSFDDIPVPNASEILKGNFDSFYYYGINMAEPRIAFNWESHVIDVKAQISKKLLLLFTPYVGVGASYGRSRAGGGIEADITVTKDGNTSSMGELKSDIDAAAEAASTLESQTEELKELLGETTTADDDNIDLTKIEIPTEGDGFLINQWVNGFSFRAFGGLSINIWVLKIDASVMYDILAESLGAQVGVRIQF